MVMELQSPPALLLYRIGSPRSPDFPKPPTSPPPDGKVSLDCTSVGWALRTLPGDLSSEALAPGKRKRQKDTKDGTQTPPVGLGS